MYTLKLFKSLFPDPRSNTGSDSQAPLTSSPVLEARLDSLTIIWTFCPSVIIQTHLKVWLDIFIDEENSIGRKIGLYWDYNYSSPTGTLLSLRHAGNGKVRCRLSISGEDCGRLGNERLRGFMVWAAKNLSDLKCTRIDLAVDDFTKKLNFKKLQQAIANKQYSGFKVADCVENFGRKHNGWTAYLGSRQSENFIRAYNKSAESKGLIDSHRWENEVKGLQAEELFSLLLEFPECPEEFQRQIINYAVGRVKFIDRTDKNISRCDLLEWWREWIEFLECTPLRIVVKRVSTSLDKSLQWLKHSVCKTIAMMHESLGSYRFQDLIVDLKDKGLERIKNIDRLKIEDYVRERVEYQDVIGHTIRIRLAEVV